MLGTDPFFDLFQDGVGGGRQWQRLFEDGVRLCASDGDLGQVACARAGIKAISVEQLAGVFEASDQTLAVVAGGWGCWENITLAKTVRRSGEMDGGAIADWSVGLC
jgi:hypothetical protein